MNCLNLFTKKVQDVSSNLFTVGMEVEFASSTLDGIKKYKKYCVDEDESIFGTDGSGYPTLEYRSPVFKSKYPNYPIKTLLKYSIEVQKYLVSEFSAIFLPHYEVEYSFCTREPLDYCDTCKGTGKYFCDICNQEHECDCLDHEDICENGDEIPLGIHYSLGDSYFSSRNIQDTLYYERSRKVQEILIDRLESDEDKDLYRLREDLYPGNFERSNSIRWNYNRTEFRFFPSCDITTLVPYFYYIFNIEKDLPKSKIKFIY